jgi:hypothetical protein
MAEAAPAGGTPAGELLDPSPRLRTAIAKLTCARRDFEMIEVEQRSAHADQNAQRLRLAIRRIKQIEDYLS